MPTNGDHKSTPEEMPPRELAVATFKFARATYEAQGELYGQLGALVRELSTTAQALIECTAALRGVSRTPPMHPDVSETTRRRLESLIEFREDDTTDIRDMRATIAKLEESRAKEEREKLLALGAAETDAKRFKFLRETLVFLASAAVAAAVIWAVFTYAVNQANQSAKQQAAPMAPTSAH